MVLTQVRRGPARSAEEDEAFKAPIRAQYERQGHPYYATARLWDDGIIDPIDTRRVLGLALSAALNAPIPTRASACSACDDRYVPHAVDRQSRRDRLPYRPHRAAHGHCDRRRLFGSRHGLAACEHRRPAVRSVPRQRAKALSNIPRIIAAARAGAEAIHPGYGSFGKSRIRGSQRRGGHRIRRAPPSAMRAMGSKATAKTLMDRAASHCCRATTVRGMTTRSSPTRLPASAFP